MLNDNQKKWIYLVIFFLFKNSNSKKKAIILSCLNQVMKLLIKFIKLQFLLNFV